MSHRAQGVPFMNLELQHADAAPEILAAWESLLRQGRFIGGAEVEAFEREWAAFTRCSAAVGVGSGTDALCLALKALGVSPGDEVITAPNTFIATVEAVTQAGGRPVFVDVDPRSANIDVERIEAAITERTRVIVPVHLFGQPAEIDPLLEIAARRGLRVLEDAAQAHGARYGDRSVGSLGDAAAFSFYPSKNLGACGEAGAVTTSDGKVERAVRVLRDHGQTSKNLHAVEGTNSRLDALQAAALRVKLRRLDEWNEDRRRVAALYDERLRDVVTTPSEAEGRRHVYHLYVIRHPERERLRGALDGAGVGTGLHYPVPVHLQPAYAWLGHSAGDFPEAESWAAQGLSLPIFPGLSEEQVDRVCGVIHRALGSRVR